MNYVEHWKNSYQIIFLLFLSSFISQLGIRITINSIPFSPFENRSTHPPLLIWIIIIIIIVIINYFFLLL